MREHAMRGALVGLVVLAIGDAIAAHLGVTPGLVPRLEGPAAWLASRAMGVTAYLALFLDAAFGLFVSTGRADRWIAKASRNGSAPSQPKAPGPWLMRAPTAVSRTGT